MIDGQADALLTLAEVAASFAGFAALVTLFSRRRVAGTALHDLLRLRLVIGASIIVVIAALVPVAANGFDFAPAVVWRLSSAVFLLLIYFTAGSFFNSYGNVRGSFSPDRLAVTVALLLEIIVQLSLLAILLGIEENRRFGLYFAALTGTIGQAAFIFLRLVESTFASITVNPEPAQDKQKDALSHAGSR